MSLFYDGAIRMARTQIILGPENAVPRPPTSVCHSQNVSAGWWKATLGARKQGGPEFRIRSRQVKRFRHRHG